MFWKRYVDDTSTAIHPDRIDEFQQHLNSIEPSIQFTREVEEENQLSFLDVLLQKDEDGHISTSVYCKPTHMDQYLQYSSHHPLSHKKSVMKTLLEKVSEGEHVINALEKNGYTRNLIRRSYRQQHSVTPITTEQPSTRATLPYIQGQSEAIRRAQKKLDIQTCFTPATTLRQILSHPKDLVQSMNRSEVVYRIPCANCNKSYMGKTGRNLSQRRKERMKAVETLSTDNCALAEYVLAEDHHIDYCHWRASIYKRPLCD